MRRFAVERVDPSSAADIADWNAVMCQAYTYGRGPMWWAHADLEVARFQSPRRDGVLHALVARNNDGTPVGGAEIDAGSGEPADVEIGVLPTFRRCGVGTALLDDVRRELHGHEPHLIQTEVYTCDGVDFAQKHGLSIGNTEFRMLVDLPVPQQVLTSVTGQGRVTVHSWVGAVPPRPRSRLGPPGNPDE